jgi:hypothetical protein
MTPKEKANELLDKCYPMFNHSVRDLFTKNCALMVVDELVKLESKLLGYDKPYTSEYWEEVKQEINHQ